MNPLATTLNIMATASLNDGLRLARRGAYAEARRRLLSAAAFPETQVLATITLCQICYRTGEMQNARQFLEQAKVGGADPHVVQQLDDALRLRVVTAEDRRVYHPKVRLAELGDYFLELYDILGQDLAPHSDAWFHAWGITKERKNGGDETGGDLRPALLAFILIIIIIIFISIMLFSS